MKRKFLFAAILSLSVFAIAASAQVTHFGGTWTLDVSKSKLGERNNIESQTLTVTQTEKDIKVEPATKRAAPPVAAPAGDTPKGTLPAPGGVPLGELVRNSGAPPSGAPAGGPQGGGGGGGRMGGGGMMGGGDTTFTYSLDGKETKTEVQGQMGTSQVSLKAKFDGAKLKLTSARTISGPMGEFSIPTKETWELSADGKTLTVDRETTTPRGSMSSTMVYTKKQ